MNQTQFESLLDRVAEQLTEDMRAQPKSEWFSAALSYEQHVRERLHEAVEAMGADGLGHEVDLDPSGQTFPDIPCGEFGVEVKFTRDDKWVSIANSVRETKRVESVKVVYLMFGKMGGLSESRWKRYDECVVHVRTSHEPRFQVDMTGEKESLFKVMGIAYDDFRKLDIMDKMPYIRAYARKIHPDGHLWWLGDDSDEDRGSDTVDPRLYITLSPELQRRYRAEATLLCPQVLIEGNLPKKFNEFKAVGGQYADAVFFLLTYHDVLCHNARDMFSAGSVAGVQYSDGLGIPNKERACKLLQDDMEKAAYSLDSALFKEYWGEEVLPDDRLAWWLKKADGYATGWLEEISGDQNNLKPTKPSNILFIDYQKRKGLK